MDWWDTLMDWLPNFVVGDVEVRDILNLIVGGLGVYLAVLATRIAQKQDRLLQEQQTQRSVLEMEIDPIGLDREGGWNEYSVRVINKGTRTATDFKWELYIPVPDKDSVRINIADSKEHELNTSIAPWGTVEEDDEMFRVWSGRCTEPVRKRRGLKLGNVQIRGNTNVNFKYTIDTEDGTFPEPDGIGDVPRPWGDEDRE
jgi:hypothetical protein